MNCEDVRENLIELLAEGSPSSGHGADPEVAAHVRQCAACTGELDSLRRTMALLDEWEAPEPSPYFLTRLRAHVKEEREKAPARSGVFSWMRRPAMAVSLATVLAAGGLIYRFGGFTEPVQPSDTGAVADVEALDRNHDVLVNTDLIDELSGSPSDDVTEE
jgi:anti-sigma factor RsiW